MQAFVSIFPGNRHTHSKTGYSSQRAADERTGFLGTIVTKRYSLSYYISAGQIPAALLPNHYRRFIVSDSATAATTALPV